jgi:hypothetical protein
MDGAALRRTGRRPDIGPLLLLLAEESVHSAGVATRHVPGTRAKPGAVQKAAVPSHFQRPFHISSAIVGCHEVTANTAKLVSGLVRVPGVVVGLI